MPLTDSDVADAPVTRTRRLYRFILGLAVFVVLADQLTKWWAETNLSDGERVPIIGDLLGFYLVYNPGAAFSIGTEYTWVLAIIAGLAVIGLTWYAWRVKSRWVAVPVGLLLGGATTHLGDRLFREPGFGRGHVVDFIDYGYFVGNVADIALVGGAILFVIVSLFVSRDDEKPAADAKPEPKPEPKTDVTPAD